MNTENQGYPNFPARPPPSSSSPFASAPPPGVPPQSGGPESVGFRPHTRPFTPSGPPMAPPVGVMRPFQSPLVSQIPGQGIRPPPPPPSSNSFPSTAYGPPGGGSFQRFPTPPPPSGPPQTQTLAGHFSPPRQPMGPPPQSLTSGVPGGYASPPGTGFQQSMPPVNPSYPGVGGPQPSFPPSSYPPQTGGFAQPPGQQNLHPSYAPPTSNVQGLAEDFNSLSLTNIPGSLEPGLDPASFPRPLDGDVEPNTFAEMYPMNSHSRYLRLTTSAIPSSQSLASRWHLPLGAVVCPLAEAPEGVSIRLLLSCFTNLELFTCHI